MLPSVGVVKVLCDSLKEFPVRGMQQRSKLFGCSFGTLVDISNYLQRAALVVDPVMVSTSGDMLSEPSTLAGYRYEFYVLFPSLDVDCTSSFSRINSFI